MASQLSSLTYVKTADGTNLFNEGTISRVEFLVDPFSEQEDASSDSRLTYVDEAWNKFTRRPML